MSDDINRCIKDKCNICKKGKKVFLTYMSYSIVADRHLIRFKKEIINFEESGIIVPEDLNHTFNARSDGNYVIIDELHKLEYLDKKLSYFGII